MKLLACLLLLALPGLAAAQTVEIQTFAGPQVVPQAPERVVVLDLAAVDSLSALGVPIAGVPEIRPPPYLADVMAGAEKVGSVFEPDPEAIAAMAPGLIVAGGRSQPKVALLAQIAPTIDMTIWEDVVGQGKARLAAYGAIFGQEAKAAALTAELDAVIAEVQALAPDAGRALILMANGGKLTMYGAGSRFGWLHSDLGLAEAFPHPAGGVHGEVVSFEFIAQTDPDWILVIDRGAAIGQEGTSAEAVLDTPMVMGTKAGQGGRILYLDSAAIYLAGGGIRAMTATVTALRDALRGQ